MARDMNGRAPRLIVVALLLAAAGGAVYWAALQQQAAEAARRNQQEIAGILQRMRVSAALLASNEQAYLTGTSSPRVTSAIADTVRALREDSASIAPRLDAGAATDVAALSNALTRIDTLNTEFRRLQQTTADDWQSLDSGAEPVPFDRLQADSRSAIDASNAALDAISGREATAADAARRGRTIALVRVLGGVSVLWAAGLIALAISVPAPRTITPAEPVVVAPEPVADNDFDLRIAPTPASVLASAPAPPPSVDLPSVASLCDAIARLTSADALQTVLGDVGRVLGASGVVLWVASGERLFPVAAHGYEPRMVARLGTIAADAHNPTADAWRTGHPRTVTATTGADAALIVPLNGLDGCAGALAAEVPAGREADPSLVAVASILAAQLSTLVSALPDESSSHEPASDAAASA
jgi:hypothetical protein